MSTEQLSLIIGILDALCVYPILPYIDDLTGINVGRCRFCGAFGHPHAVHEVALEHSEQCPMTLLDALKRSVETPEAAQNEESEQEAPFLSRDILWRDL